jgi:hypothetical protein
MVFKSSAVHEIEVEFVLDNALVGEGGTGE